MLSMSTKIREAGGAQAVVVRVDGDGSAVLCVKDSITNLPTYSVEPIDRHSPPLCAVWTVARRSTYSPILLLRVFVTCLEPVSL